MSWSDDAGAWCKSAFGVDPRDVAKEVYDKAKAVEKEIAKDAEKVVQAVTNVVSPSPAKPKPAQPAKPASATPQGGSGGLSLGGSVGRGSAVSGRFY